MGKRPYYIINTCVDYDGYNTMIDYVGTNWRAAYNRYLALVDIIKQREFLDENVPEDSIEVRVHRADKPLTPNQSVWSYLNDQNDCYISIQLVCVNTNEFTNPITERAFKMRYPDSKY